MGVAGIPFVLHLDACMPFLDAQLAAAAPQVILTLGLVPLRRLLGSSAQVERDHGKLFAFHTSVVVPTFHPSSLHWRAGRRDVVLSDLRTVRLLLER